MNHGSDLDQHDARPLSKRRLKATAIKDYRCVNLIAVLECPSNIGNIGTVVRNVNALGVEKIYIIDPERALPDDWHDMREDRPLTKTSASAIKWSFVKRFDNTEDCIAHLAKNQYVSIATSPHVKGKAHAEFDNVDYTVYAKLAIWFGSETAGISDEAGDNAELFVSIPMFGMIESLNLGTSTGIVLYEITKQRRKYQSQFRRSGRRDPIG